MEKPKARWIVISVAHSAEEAQAASDLLTREGFLVRVSAEPADSDVQLYEIRCLSSEAIEARSLLSGLKY